MMEAWQLESMEEHARAEGWLGDEAVYRLIDAVRKLQEIEHSRCEETGRLRAALKQYGRHGETCGRAYYEGAVPCRCGLDDVMRGEQ